jgi:outer membrane receptor protein involved in Fe transport
MSTAGYAQQAGPNVETVVVTGSRIPQRGLEAASPVTVVGQQEVQLQGATSIGNVLQSLPSVVNDGDNDYVNNGSGGLSTIDLRNLGTNRTLVLVDGKRLVASDNALDVDTNDIPAGMVDHVELLTGGDSAVYGSDAVAGVVNIVLKKDFQGLQADTQFSLTDHGDGLRNDTYVMLGFNSPDGKGNVTIYADYMHRDPVLGPARDFSAHALAANNFSGCAGPATHFGGFCYSGSGTIPNGRVKSAALGGPYVGDGTMFTTSGTLVPYDGSTFNFAQYQYLQTQGQRWAFGAEGHYQITKDIEFYTRLTFAESSTVDQLGPSPMVSTVDINCGNPLMSVEERQTIFGTTNTAGTIEQQCATVPASVLTNPANGNMAGADPAAVQRLVSFALRLSAVGPRITFNDHDTFQLVGGFKGDLGISDWSYDFSAQYGQSTGTFNEFNDASKGYIQDALLVNPATQQCYAITTPACVPLNVFTYGGINAAQANYIRENLAETTEVKQMLITGDIVGDLGDYGGTLPWAHDPIGFSIGAEYRQESAGAYPDQNLQDNNLVGFESIAQTIGEFDVAEGFGEVDIPVVQDMPFAKSIDLRGAYRFSAYDRAGDAETYRAGLTWAPVDDFKFRASYDRAVRAPNVNELFTPPGSSSANSGFDPCSANAHGVATTAALCEATGVPAGSVFSATLNCPTNQCQGAVGGNPFLKPEVATTRELGIVLTPSFIRGFTGTIDYYDIKIEKYITETPLETIVTDCYSTAVNTAQSASFPYCSFIHRDVLGEIDTAGEGYVVQAEGNVGADHVRGIDFEVNYQADLADWGLGDVGTLASNYKATWVQTNDLFLPGAPVIQCAGLYGLNCGAPQSRYKHAFRVSWGSPNNDLLVSLNWRYTSGAKLEPDLGYSPVPPPIPTLNMPAMSYLDLSAVWDATTSVEFRAGVSNILGTNPPVTDNNSVPANDINNNTFPSTYDVLGRVIFIGATIKL